jgi:hypothetical protein
VNMRGLRNFMQEILPPEFDPVMFTEDAETKADTLAEIIPLALQFFSKMRFFKKYKIIDKYIIEHIC